MDPEKLTDIKEDTTPEDRKEQVEHSTTIAKRMEKKLDKALNNLDAGAGGLAVSLFVLSGTYVERGDWQNAIIFMVIAVFMSLVKHRLPDGNLGKWLKKDPGKMLEDATNTFIGRNKNIK